MRELDRLSQPLSASAPTRVAIVGAGRVGIALARALAEAGIAVSGPLGRGAAPTGVDAVLLCVPDAEIAAAAALVPGGAPVGHCSGATGLEVLAGHEAFSLHPLMTVTGESGPAHPTAFPAGRPGPFAGAGAAVAGSTPRALELARRWRGCRPAADEIDPEAAPPTMPPRRLRPTSSSPWRRPPSGWPTTVGVEREDLVPWSAPPSKLGPARARAGADRSGRPGRRGDRAAPARAVAERAPELLELFDALVAATRDLAGARAVPR